MSNSGLISDLIDELAHQFEATLPDLKDRLMAAARISIADNSELLLRWAEMASAGSLSHDEVDWLIKSRLDLSKMKMLEEAGLSKVQVDLLRQTMTRTVIGMITGRILPGARSA